MSKTKRTYSIISLSIFLLFMAIGTAFIWTLFKEFNGNPELFKQAIDRYGQGNNAVIFVGLQILQIIFPVLPGELIEVGAGYMFGPYLGLILCEVGIILSSIPIFLLSRKFGSRLVENIFSSNKIKSLEFLTNERRLTVITFLLFLIPGTPKDLVTYVIGLTPIKLKHFIFCTVIARIPSILTSTYAGYGIATGASMSVIVIYTITAVISGISLIAYSIYTKKKRVND